LRESIGSTLEKRANNMKKFYEELLLEDRADDVPVMICAKTHVGLDITTTHSTLRTKTSVLIFFHYQCHGNCFLA